MRTLIREIGKTKAVLFSTHILEEVEAACSRAIIIDRGRIVANGTPGELKAMSDVAGAVTLAVDGVEAAVLGERLAALPEALRCDEAVATAGVAVRVFPRDRSVAGLTRAVIELAEREHWRVLQLRTEEGQLDEVFRKLTLPDTVKK